MGYELTSPLRVKVTPRARKTEWAGVMSDGTMKVKLKALPEDGEANIELLRFLRAETGKEWEIVSGWTSTKKVIKGLT